MKPAVGARSFTSTALTSVADLGSCPAMFCRPEIGIQITRSTGVLVGLRIPTTT